MEKVDGKWHEFFLSRFFLAIGRHFPWNLLNDSEYWRMIKQQQRNLHPCSDSSFTAHVKDGDNEQRNRFPLDCKRVCFALRLENFATHDAMSGFFGLVTYRVRYKLILNTWRGKLAFDKMKILGWNVCELSRFDFYSIEKKFFQIFA